MSPKKTPGAQIPPLRSAMGVILFISVLVLLMILWRMTDFQDAWLTLWHYAVFLVDIFVVSRFCLALVETQVKKSPAVTGRLSRFCVGAFCLIWMALPSL